MSDKKSLEIINDVNEFELVLRLLGNEIVAIKLAASNFNGKLIMWSIILMIFTFLIMDVFGISQMMGITSID
jgi:hypothetical protein